MQAGLDFRILLSAIEVPQASGIVLPIDDQFAPAHSSDTSFVDVAAIIQPFYLDLV
jgi:hypothetical protein